MSEKLDSLYQLLPEIYRSRDAAQGYPLRALLRVIAEQADLVESDIRQLYENWFVETCQDWVVPYLGDLIGYRFTEETAAPWTEAMIATRLGYLIPRREVANTIRYRRRKGTLPLLEELARDVAGWPARVKRDIPGVKEPGYTEQELGTGLEPPLGQQKPGVWLEVWRLKTYPVFMTPAHCLESEGDHCYLFSVLGNNTPLHARAVPETDPAHIAEDINLPVVITRKRLKDHPAYYGKDSSLAIWAEDWPSLNAPQPIPVDRIEPTDLGNWENLPSKDHVGVDPGLGRIVFPPEQLPPGEVRVAYQYAFSANIGGGAYERPLQQPDNAVFYRVVKMPRGAPHLDEPDLVEDEDWEAEEDKESRVCRSLQRALERWREDQPLRAVIEIDTDEIYTEVYPRHDRHEAVHHHKPVIELEAGQYLQIRAANKRRPVLHLLDRWTDRLDDLRVEMAPGSRFVLDGLLIMGRGVRVEDPRLRKHEKPSERVEGLAEEESFEEVPEGPADPWATRRGRRSEAVHTAETLDAARYSGATGEPAEAEQRETETQLEGELAIRPVRLSIRHCTLVPGWLLKPNCDPVYPEAPSLDVALKQARVSIEHSILGSIQITHNDVKEDPIRIEISDSILDATREDGEHHCEALGAPGWPWAHALLNFRRCTVFGRVLSYAIELAENSIFMGLIRVGRQQIGCMRFCYVRPGSHTPCRHHCQPDLVCQPILDKFMHGEITEKEKEQELKAAQDSVRPTFTSPRYGTPGYCQLARGCSDKITRGAEDGSEMGVWHDLYQPQREANLRARLEEYLPAEYAPATSAEKEKIIWFRN
jgi:hypothetical protein